MESSISTSKKKTLGRRKIEIKKIEKKTSLQVTFAKRRRGLFRKASELAVLCGAEVAILVQSPAKKMYAFAHPSVGTLLDRVSPSPPAGQIVRHCHDDVEGRRKLEEAVMALEMEKRRAAAGGHGGGGGFWWDDSVEGLGVQELEEYLKDLEDLEGNVSERLNEFEKAKIVPSPSIQGFCNASSVQDFCNASSVHDFCTSSSIQDFCNASSIQELGDGFLENPYPLMIEDGFGLEILDFQDLF